MISYELHYYSNSQSESTVHRLSSTTLYEALKEAHAFDASDANFKFRIGLWARGRGATAEMIIKNQQWGLPRQPLIGSWRTDFQSLLWSLDPQVGGSELREVYRAATSQLIELLIITSGLSADQLSAWLANYALLDRLLADHEAVRAGSIEFSYEIQRLMNKIYYDCPAVPESFSFEDNRIFETGN